MYKIFPTIVLVSQLSFTLSFGQLFVVEHISIKSSQVTVKKIVRLT